MSPEADLDFELVLEDGVPLETHYHRLQMVLFLELVYRRMVELGREDVFIGGDMFVYYSPEQARAVAEEERQLALFEEGLRPEKPEKVAYRGPDAFLVKGAARRRRDIWYGRKTTFSPPWSSSCCRRPRRPTTAARRSGFTSRSSRRRNTSSIRRAANRRKGSVCWTTPTSRSHRPPSAGCGAASWRPSSGCGTANTRASRGPGCGSTIPTVGWCRRTPSVPRGRSSSSSRRSSAPSRNAVARTPPRPRMRDFAPASPRSRAELRLNRRGRSRVVRELRTRGNREWVFPSR